MPKKKLTETAEQQAERFKRAVQDMIDAGELNPADADRLFDKAMGGVVRLRQEWFGAPDQENSS